MKRLLIVVLFGPSLLLAQEPREGGRESRVPQRPDTTYADTLGPGPRRALALGIVGYGGGDWAPTGIEAAMLWSLGGSGRTAAGVSLALGTFNQANAVLFGRSTGFYAALGLTARQGLVDLTEMGTDRNPSKLRLELHASAELSADLATPLPQGLWDLRLALLPGIAIGSATGLGQSVGIYFGPAAFVGKTATTHAEFALRFRLPAR